MNATQYTLVTGTATQVVKAVNELLKQGWELHGGPVSDSDAEETRIVQAMVMKVLNSEQQQAQDAYRLAYKVAKLNPDNPEIGAGMLKQLVADARRIMGVE